MWVYFKIVLAHLITYMGDLLKHMQCIDTWPFTWETAWVSSTPLWIMRIQGMKSDASSAKNMECHLVAHIFTCGSNSTCCNFLLLNLNLQTTCKSSENSENSQTSETSETNENSETSETSERANPVKTVKTSENSLDSLDSLVSPDSLYYLGSLDLLISKNFTVTWNPVKQRALCYGHFSNPKYPPFQMVPQQVS